MISINIANHLLKTEHGKQSPSALLEEALGPSNGKKPDEISIIIRNFLCPEMCEQLPGIKWRGELHSEVMWELDKSAKSRLSATVIIANWIESTKWKATIPEFEGQPFHRVFEDFITLVERKDTNYEEEVEWVNAGKTDDGGVDAYGIVGEKKLFIVQAKTSQGSPKVSWIRELFGSCHLYENNTDFKKKFLKHYLNLIEIQREKGKLGLTASLLASYLLVFR